jgi:hypothetical protein
MRRRVPRRVRHLASILYANNYAEACRQEVEVRFDTGKRIQHKRYCCARKEDASEGQVGLQARCATRAER